MPQTRQVEAEAKGAGKGQKTKKTPKKSSRPPLSPQRPRDKTPPKEPAFVPPATVGADPEGDISVSSVVTGESYISSSGRVRPGVPAYVQKQLVDDIEEAGGIKLFGSSKQEYQALAALLDTNIELYGERGDALRTKLRKKVNHWSTLAQKGLYADKVLNRYGIVSAQHRDSKSKSSAKKVPPAKKKTDRSEEDSVSSLDDEDDEEVVVEGREEKQEAVPTTPPIARQSKMAASAGTLPDGKLPPGTCK
jgi:hypothetical protein